VFIDRRRCKPELYVADRGNARIQVFDLDGRFQRVVGVGWLTSPSAFAIWNGYLVIAELNARLALLDADDSLVDFVGEDATAPERGGWPNALDEHGHVIRNPRVRKGKFVSPHAVAADADGGLLVAEWLIGGRYTRLTLNGSESATRR
jgi:hypothetical protein